MLVRGCFDGASCKDMGEIVDLAEICWMNRDHMSVSTEARDSAVRIHVELYIVYWCG